MYSLLGPAKFLKLYAWVAVALAVFAFVLSHGLVNAIPATALGLIRAVFAAAGIGILGAGAMVWLGQTKMFPWACRTTWLGRVFPDIDGTWSGVLDSNINVIVERDPRLKAELPTWPVLSNPQQ